MNNNTVRGKQCGHLYRYILKTHQGAFTHGACFPVVSVYSTIHSFIQQQLNRVRQLALFCGSTVVRTHLGYIYLHIYLLEEA